MWFVIIKEENRIHMVSKGKEVMNICWVPDTCQALSINYLIYSSQQTKREILFSMYRWENWGQERLNNLTKSTELIFREARISIWVYL